MAQSLISFPANTRVRQPLAFVDASGAVVNLTGVDPLAIYIRRENTTVITASLANAKLTVTNAASGLARMDLEAEDTEGLHGEFKYEAWGTLSSVSQLLGRGSLIISRTTGGA